MTCHNAFVREPGAARKTKSRHRRKLEPAGWPKCAANKGASSSAYHQTNNLQFRFGQPPKYLISHRIYRDINRTGSVVTVANLQLDDVPLTELLAKLITYLHKTRTALAQSKVAATSVEKLRLWEDEIRKINNKHSATAATELAKIIRNAHSCVVVVLVSFTGRFA